MEIAAFVVNSCLETLKFVRSSTSVVCNYWNLKYYRVLRRRVLRLEIILWRGTQNLSLRGVRGARRVRHTAFKLRGDCSYFVEGDTEFEFARGPWCQEGETHSIQAQ
jgi:hypothetical protein